MDGHKIEGLDQEFAAQETEATVAADSAARGVTPDKVIEVGQETAAVTEEKEPAPTTCVYCGKSLERGLDLAVPDDEDKAAWLDCVLGGNRFTKRYSLFGGKVEITYRERILTETEAILQQLTSEVSEGALPAIAAYVNPRYNLRMNKLMLAASIKKVVFKPDSPETRVITFPTLTTTGGVAKLLDLLAEVAANEGLYSCLLARYQHFEAVCAMLVNWSNDPNFQSEAENTR